MTFEEMFPVLNGKINAWLDDQSPLVNDTERGLLVDEVEILKQLIEKTDEFITALDERTRFLGAPRFPEMGCDPEEEQR